MILDKAIGVFIVASVGRLRTFSEDEIALYSGFSGQAAQTIENVRLYRSEHEYKKTMVEKRQPSYSID
jgi:GAF domain-containing protein